MPCADCGASVALEVKGAHQCDPSRRSKYQELVTKASHGTFESQLDDYLDSAEGRFETWLAARLVRGSDDAGHTGR